MNKDIKDAYDYDDPIDRPMIDDVRDDQECKHKETRYLSDHVESNKEVNHDHDIIICCYCGVTIKEFLEGSNE